jgi:hypothetical protein
MGLKLPPLPKGADELVSRALHRAMATGRLAREAALGGAAVVPAGAHQVYSLGLEDIVGGRTLGDARPTGWRVLVFTGREALASVEFEATATATGGGPAATGDPSVNYGPFVRATVDAFATAEQHPEVIAQDYEARLLEVPGLYLMALWLRGDRDSLYLPMSPAPSSLSTERLYREREFRQELVPMAKLRLAQRDLPPEGEMLRSR